MIRITLRRDDGELGVTYVDSEDEIQEVLKALNCELVSQRPSSKAQMGTEQMLALGGGLSMKEIAENDPLGSSN